MKKNLKVTGFDCGVCAAKAERAICRIEGVQNASINLISERLSLEFEGDETKILNQVAAVCKKVEPDAVLHIA